MYHCHYAIFEKIQTFKKKFLEYRFVSFHDALMHLISSEKRVMSYFPEDSDLLYGYRIEI